MKEMIIQDTNYPKLTITSERITIKIPSFFNQIEKDLTNNLFLEFTDFVGKVEHSLRSSYTDDFSRLSLKDNKKETKFSFKLPQWLISTLRGKNKC